MEFISESAEETRKIACNFVYNLETKFPNNQERAKVVGLYGELGSGKTTFMKGVAEFFGINETVQSPTFVIEKIYEISGTGDSELGTGFNHLIHIDAYRIEKLEEMINLGWHEIIADSQNLVFIEWPERIVDIMPDHIKIYFDHLSENERKITIPKNG